MVNFDYMTPTRLIFGKDSIEKLPEVMKQFGPKILLTYGRYSFTLDQGGENFSVLFAALTHNDYSLRFFLDYSTDA